MTFIRRATIICTLLWLATPHVGLASKGRDDLALWYRQPAANWVAALPIGNGSMGAMIFGQPAKEHIQFNEDSVWAGGPEDYINSKASPEVLGEVRQLLFDGKQREAEQAAWDLMSEPLRQMPYQPFGDLFVDFPGHENVDGYRRQLDLDSAVVSVTYRHDGVRYRREIFASHPARAIVMRVTADKPGALSFRASLTSPHADIATMKIDTQTLAIRGRVVDFDYERIKQVIPGRLKLAARLRVVTDGGTVNATDEAVQVDGADAATLVLVAATSYRDYQDVSAKPSARCASFLEKLAGQRYERLKQTHMDDYRRLFRRCSLDLGRSETAELPTDERQLRLSEQPDTPFAALFFQYGRYLLIASSRLGSHPANLQGIWNDSLTPVVGQQVHREH